MWWWHPLQHWLAYHTGSLNTPGAPPDYNFWSGVAGSFAVNLVVFGLGLWWHNQCHVSGCYWYARRKTAANERACFLHHPHGKRTVKDIHAAHHAAKGGGSDEAR